MLALHILHHSARGSCLANGFFPFVPDASTCTRLEQTGETWEQQVV